jgi:uncharacterized OB-fold protein
MSSAVPYNKPLPKIDALTRPFWENAKRGKLAIQACKACGDRHFPPTPICPNCMSRDQEWQIASGRGELLSWAVFHRAYWDSFAGDLPYSVCIVRLEEGPVVAGSLVESKEAEPRVGDTVEASFDPVTDEVSLMRFRVLARRPSGSS